MSSQQNQQIQVSSPAVVQQKRLERERKKQEKKKEKPVNAIPTAKPSITREWDELPGVVEDGFEKVRIISWNALAQILIKRELFPGSDCLRWTQRGSLIMNEVLQHDPDIACLQEIDADRLESTHRAILESHGYRYAFTTGYPKKAHGLLIIWKDSSFSRISEKIIRLDDFQVEPDRKAGSRVTRNIAFLVSLERRDSSGRGIIVSNTHLFWHPSYVYERSRQCGIILKAARDFMKSDDKFKDWTCILAGDYNIQPSEISYSLLAGTDGIHRTDSESFTETQKTEYTSSQVIHFTLDPTLTVDSLNSNKVTGGEGEEEGNEGRVLTNVRPAKDSDRLLTLEEMKRILYDSSDFNLRSCYGSFHSLSPSTIEFSPDRTPSRHPDSPFFFNRPGGNGMVYKDDASISISTSATTTSTTTTNINATNINEQFSSKSLGAFEPAFTNFTPLWRCCLDYIWIAEAKSEDLNGIGDRRGGRTRVKGLMRIPAPSSLEPGLPRKGVGLSDHIMIGADILFPI